MDALLILTKCFDRGERQAELLRRLCPTLTSNAILTIGRNSTQASLMPKGVNYPCTLMFTSDRDVFLYIDLMYLKYARVKLKLRYHCSRGALRRPSLCLGTF